MYNKGKYIVGEIKTEYGTSVTALCFNEVVSHDTFRNMFTEIYGAGFFSVIDDRKVTAYDKSVSLNVKSRGEQDELQILRALGMGDPYA